MGRYDTVSTRLAEPISVKYSNAPTIGNGTVTDTAYDEIILLQQIKNYL
jgi:hypothetical protein